MFKEKMIQLLREKEFLAFKKEHPSAYLTHAFYMADEVNSQDIQFGFYEYQKDIITTFVFENDVVSMRQEKEIFRKEKSKLVPVDENKVVLDIEEVLPLVKAFQKENYPAAKSMKKIMILQTLPVGTVWNVTFVLQSFQTLNMKIDAQTGEIKEHKCISLIADPN